MTSLKLSLLGAPRIELDGRRIELKPRKALALLVYLALTGEEHARDSLATLFWPEASQRVARASLRRRLSELSGALGEQWVESTRESVGLTHGLDLWLDVVEHGQRLQACQVHGHETPALCLACRDALTAAVTLYRGDFLSGFSLLDAPGFDEWHFFHAEKLRQAQASALERLALWHGSQGDGKEAIEYARARLALDPWHEPAHRTLMQLYGDFGQRAAAIRQYEECHRLLTEELGVLPDEATQALYAALKRAPSSASSATSGTSLTALTSPSLPAPVPARTAAQTPEETVPAAPPTPFVGRTRELAALTGAMAQAHAGHGQIRFVTGGAGSGKTMLVQELVRQAQVAHPDLLPIQSHCHAYTGVGDPYLPFRDALALLAGEVEAHADGDAFGAEHVHRLERALPTTLPALVEHAPDLIGPFVATQRLRARAATFAAPAAAWFQQLTMLGKREPNAALEERHIFAQYTAALKVIATHHPLLLILEDLHWVDLSSSALLFHLSRAIGASRILIVGTYRPDEVAQGVGREQHPLAGMVAEFKRQHGAIWLDLGEVTPQEGRDFVNAYVDTEPNRLDTHFRDALFRHTAGHALFTAELLGTMQERGDLRRDGDGRWIVTPQLDWHALPAKVEGVIERQLTRLDDDARAILRVACVHGENFTAEVIARVLQLDDQALVQQLSQGLARRQRLVSAQELVWLGEQRLSHYRFRHYLFQQYLYQSLDPMERTYLHEAVGRALASIYGEDDLQIAVQLAHHFREAGRIEKAVDALFIVVKRAHQLAAFHEAIHHLREGLALLQTLPKTQARLQQEIDFLVALAAAMDSAGNYDLNEIEQIFLRARALCQAVGERAKMWQILSGLFWVHFQRGQYHHAYHLAEEQLRLSEHERNLEPRLIACWMMSSVLLGLGDFALAVEYAEQMESLYAASNYAELRYRYSNFDIKIEGISALCVTKWIAGYPDQGRRHGEIALEIARESGHPYMIGQALLQCVWTHDARGEVAHMRMYIEEMGRLAAEHQFHFFLAQARMFEGCLLMDQGQAEVGMARLQQALADMRAFGHKLGQSHYATLEIRGYMALGQYQTGLELIEACLAAVEQSREHWFDAELLRLKGELLRLQGEAAAVVEPLYEEAIAIAQRQHGKIWELRATVSLCRLWRARGEAAAAHARLVQIYSWFTEGFGTPDLREAKALLDDLVRKDINSTL